MQTCVVSTDRDAFQLVSENVSLMMTPRGVSDVKVYTPERVEARYGIGPQQMPDFIGLKGDSSDNIPGVPGIGDKTAGKLVAQYGSLEEVIEHVDELSPARAKAIREHADRRASRSASRRCAATWTSTATPPSSCSRRPSGRKAEGDVPALRVPATCSAGSTSWRPHCPPRPRPGSRAPPFAGAEGTTWPRV